MDLSHTERRTTISADHTGSKSPVEVPNAGSSLLTAIQAGKPAVRCEYCGKERFYIRSPLTGRYLLYHCECVLIARRKHEDAMRREEECRRINRLFQESNIGKKLLGATFESFERIPGTEKALEWCKAYAASFSRETSESAVLFGMPGCGKSHMAAATGKEIIRRTGMPFVFCSVTELLSRIKATYGGRNNESEQELIMTLIHAPLVVMDDIGAQYNGKREGNETPWAEDVIYRIVDGRYRHSRPIIFTANVDADGLKKLEALIGARTYDRLIEMCTLLPVTADSYRRKIAGERLEKQKGKG
jgi:DNA replication protein DnaC